MATDDDVRSVSIREASIRLGQFLKLADFIDRGSDAKALLDDGIVAVNGEPEDRRGRHLYPGDVVTVDGQPVKVGPAPADPSSGA